VLLSDLPLEKGLWTRVKAPHGAYLVILLSAVDSAYSIHFQKRDGRGRMKRFDDLDAPTAQAVLWKLIPRWRPKL